MQSFHSHMYCREGSTGCGLGEEAAGWESVDLLFIGLPQGFAISMLLALFLLAGVAAAAGAVEAEVTAGEAIEEAGTDGDVTFR